MEVQCCYSHLTTSYTLYAFDRKNRKQSSVIGNLCFPLASGPVLCSDSTKAGDARITIQHLDTRHFSLMANYTKMSSRSSQIGQRFFWTECLPILCWVAKTRLWDCPFLGTVPAVNRVASVCSSWESWPFQDHHLRHVEIHFQLRILFSSFKGLYCDNNEIKKWFCIPFLFRAGELW